MLMYKKCDTIITFMLSFEKKFTQICLMRKIENKFQYIDTTTKEPRVATYSIQYSSLVL